MDGVCNMQNLSIHMENCYGIKKLETEFDFSGRNVYAIYAPNGVMKTSFAKAFADFSRGVESKDLMFPTRVTVREIKDESNTEIDKAKVFVIEAYNENYKSDKISTLLVNKELKDEYDEIYSNIDMAVITIKSRSWPRVFNIIKSGKNMVVSGFLLFYFDDGVEFAELI